MQLFKKIFFSEISSITQKSFKKLAFGTQTSNEFCNFPVTDLQLPAAKKH